MNYDEKMKKIRRTRGIFPATRDVYKVLIKYCDDSNVFTLGNSLLVEKSGHPKRTVQLGIQQLVENGFIERKLTLDDNYLGGIRREIIVM